MKNKHYYICLASDTSKTDGNVTSKKEVIVQGKYLSKQTTSTLEAHMVNDMGDFLIGIFQDGKYRTI